MYTNAHMCIFRINGSKGKNHFENGMAEIGHNKPLNIMQACTFNSLGKSHAILESLLQAFKVKTWLVNTCLLEQGRKLERLLKVPPTKMNNAGYGDFHRPLA